MDPTSKGQEVQKKVRKPGKKLSMNQFRKCVSRLTIPTEIPACEMEYTHLKEEGQGDHSTREDPKYCRGFSMPQWKLSDKEVMLLSL